MKTKKIEILFEDEHICVINKPAGILSVPSHDRDKSVLSILEEIMRKKGTFSQKHRPFAVHRLDRDTSGVMMFALNEATQKKLMDGWHNIVTERLYRALAENPKNPKKSLPDSGLIDDDLAFNAYNIGFVPKNSEKDKKSQNLTKNPAKNLKTVPARTYFKVITRGKTHTLFELSLDTGKKNQIRAHLASKGYPLEGDKNFFSKSDYFNRLCLHARTLCFTHPVTGKNMRFEIPEDPKWDEYAKSQNSKNLTDQKRSPHKNAKNQTRKPAKNPTEIERHISAKEKAHLNFIELGKLKASLKKR